MRVLFGFIAMSFLAIAAQAAPATVGDYPMRAQQVVPNVYAVISPARDFPNPENKGWNSNAAFVVTGAGVLVIDTGSSETIGKALRKTIAAVTNQPVRWIINTHGHADHWLGNAALADAKTEVIASSTVRDRIVNEGKDWIERFGRMTGGATGTSRIVKPTHVYDARVAIAFGDLKAELIPSNDGHSPGDLIVWLPKERVVFGGDVLYVERAPATFEAKVAPWIDTLKTIEALQPAWVVPGHGPVATGDAVPRLRAYFEDLWKIVEQGYAANQQAFEIQPAARKAMAKHARHYPDFEKRLGESVSHVYLQVEAAAFK